MSSYTFQPQNSASPDESEVREFYRQMLDGWNNRSAYAFTVLSEWDGESIGFDGSPLVGRTEIVSKLR